MMDSEKKPTLRVVIFLYSSRFVTSMHLFPERAECWMRYILLWILYLYLFVIHNLRDFFLKQHLLHDIVVGFIFMAQNTNLVSVLSKICPNFAGHVWQDWHKSRTLPPNSNHWTQNKLWHILKEIQVLACNSHFAIEN
jgi:hypothetical protein